MLTSADHLPGYGNDIMAIGADYSLLLVVGIALLVLGGVLLVLAVRGGRLGTTPHCRRCGYNLTGLTANACPECGGVCDARGVVWGTRRRSRPALLSALIVLALGGSLGGVAAYVQVQRGNPYLYYPQFMLVPAAKADTPRAVAELLRRCQSGAVTGSRADQVAAIGLRRQAAPGSTPVTQDWIDVVYALYNADLLSDAQKETFLQQMIAPVLEARSPVRLGDFLPYRVRGQARTPSTGLAVGLVSQSFQIGSETRDVGRSRLRLQGVGSSGNLGGAIGPLNLPPGDYPVRAKVAQQVFRANGMWSDEPIPFWTRELALSGEVKIAPADAPDAITVVDDPALADEVRDAIHMGAVEVTPTDEGDTAHVHVMVHIGPATAASAGVPMDVAFDMRIRLSVGEFDLGDVAAQPGQNLGSGGQANVPAFDDQTATIILRTSRDVAVRTVDMVEIWDGELVFEDIPIQRAASAPAEK